MHFSCMKFFGGLFIYVILPNYALGILNKRAISLFCQVQLFQSMKSHITFSSQIIYYIHQIDTHPLNCPFQKCKCTFFKWRWAQFRRPYKKIVFMVLYDSFLRIKLRIRQLIISFIRKPDRKYIFYVYKYMEWRV